MQCNYGVWININEYISIFAYIDSPKPGSWLNKLVADTFFYLLLNTIHFTAPNVRVCPKPSTRHRTPNNCIHLSNLVLISHVDPIGDQCNLQCFFAIITISCMLGVYMLLYLHLWFIIESQWLTNPAISSRSPQTPDLPQMPGHCHLLVPSLASNPVVWVYISSPFFDNLAVRRLLDLLLVPNKSSSLPLWPDIGKSYEWWQGGEPPQGGVRFTCISCVPRGTSRSRRSS